MLLGGGSIRYSKYLFIIWVFCSLVFLFQSAEAQSNSTEKIRVFKNRYVVELKESVASSSAVLDQNDPEESKLFERKGARLLKSLGAGREGRFKLVSSNKSRSNRSFKRNNNGTEEEQEELVDHDPDDTFCIDMIKSGIAEYCSPDFEIKISNTTPNDTHYSSLWGLHGSYGIDAPSAWGLSTGSDQIVVAVIDTGVDYNHPDLAANMWKNPGEIVNGIDDDGNGYIDDVYGWNASANNGNPFDDNGHGTHCAGTIGGIGNNARGVAGVNWNVKIMALKFLNQHGSGSLSGAISSINYMVTMKNRGVNVRVSNNSWGGGTFNQGLYDAISRANTAGIIFVAAAGNESNDNDFKRSFPSGYEVPNVVAVAASDKDGNLAGFSNYGANTVHIAAPGVGIVSTYPGNKYASLSGTSMATPHVAGALALLLGHQPSLTNAQAIQRLYATGRNLPTLNGLVKTSRLLNVGNMLHNRTTPLPVPVAPPPTCSYGASAVNFNPDTAALSAPVIIRADEYNFHTVDLGFSFPFYGQNVSRIVVSPNGLVYTKSIPSGMDYINKRQAPINSIAALHTDLATENHPYAVRLKKASNHVTIYWHAETYSKRNMGDIKAWLTIYSNGVIDSHVNIENGSLLQFVKGNSTIGVTGPSSSFSTTYSYNDNKLQRYTGVRFVPQCAGSGAPGGLNVRRVNVTSRATSKNSRAILPGKGLNINLIGSGSGTVQVHALFNGQSCSSAYNTSFSNGASLVARMPRSSNIYSRFRVVAGNAARNSKIQQNRIKRVNNRRMRNIRANRLDKVCAQFFNSLSTR